jgi:hypothetical protein
LRENVVEVRNNVTAPKLNRAQRLQEEIQRKEEELNRKKEEMAILLNEIQEIMNGDKDDELIEEAIELANRVAEMPKVVKAKKVKAEGAKGHTIKRRLALDDVLEEGDAVFVKSHPHLVAIWDNGVFKVMSDDVDENADEGEFYSFKSLNQVNLFHHKEILGKPHEPNAWKAYALRRADGEVVELDDVFLA